MSRLFFTCMLFTCLYIHAASGKDTDIRQKIREAILKAREEFSNNHALASSRTKRSSLLTGVRRGSSLWHQALFARSRDPARVARINENANIALAAQRNFRCGNLGPNCLRREPLLSTFREEIRIVCTSSQDDIVCDANAEFRTPDGTCNNLQEKFMGAAMTPQGRFLHPDYDTDNQPRTRSVKGGLLPSARLISNKLFNSGTSSCESKLFTVMLMTFGQFLDHDITQTPTVMGPGNEVFDCCSEEDREKRDCFPISVPPGDGHFHKCLSLTRSAAAVNNLCDPDDRQQINGITSYIDGSAIYGSDLNTQLLLRGGDYRVGGLLLYSEGGLLPEGGDSCIKNGNEFCFQAGDGRVMEITSLTAIHTIFLRYHNYLAKELAKINPNWDDEMLFQTTRKILGAVWQHIIYNEYLPAVLGKFAMAKYGLYSRFSDRQNIYDPSSDASIRNAFSAAAFRFGHSLITNHLIFLDENFEEVRKDRLDDHFNRAEMSFAQQAIEFLTRWMVTYPQGAEDRLFSDSIRQFLFKGSDLPSLNIQRGRDHGLPSYNRWRKWCGLRPAFHFGDSYAGLTSHNAEERKMLADLYKTPEDIDLFVGAITERHVRNGIVGPTFACIIGEQFRHLKVGDRFWYENMLPRTGFSFLQLREIKKMRLSSVICQTVDIGKIQPFALEIPTAKRNNELLDCDCHPQIDLQFWKE